MEYRKLCKNGPPISVLGLGTWPIGGGMGHIEEKTAVATIQAAIDNGITTIDTAEFYRNSEMVIGKALMHGYRTRCFLATKVSYDFSRKGIETALHNSLQALGTDYVDLYQIHSWNPAYPIEESIEAMERLSAQGKTRYIGVSNFNKGQMRIALRAAGFDSNQLRYNMFDRGIETEVMPFCEEKSIGILAHSPLAKGILTGKYGRDHIFAPDDERSGFPRFQREHFAKYCAITERLKQVAEQKGVTLIQLSIAWILRKKTVSCVLVGAKSPKQVEEHLGSLDMHFSEGEFGNIDGILASDPKVPHS